jgi:hypothetical protein
VLKEVASTNFMVQKVWTRRMAGGGRADDLDDAAIGGQTWLVQEEV